MPSRKNKLKQALSKFQKKKPPSSTDSNLLESPHLVVPEGSTTQAHKIGQSEQPQPQNCLRDTDCDQNCQGAQETLHQGTTSKKIKSTNSIISNIPPDVWTLVWGYLSPLELASVMQTCRYFHSSAAITLYRQVIVSDPSQLFYGLNDYPKNGRLSKQDLIGHIQHVHFAYKTIKVCRDDKWYTMTYGMLDYWECLPSFSDTLDQFKRSIEQMETFISNQDSRTLNWSLFTNLKTITFGYREKQFFEDHDQYSYYSDEFNNVVGPDFSESLTFKRERNDIGLAWMKNLQNLIRRPVHVCREVANGPLGCGYDCRVPGQLKTARFYDSDNLPLSITTHYDSRHLWSLIRPNIILGTLNRWILKDIDVDMDQFEFYPFESEEKDMYLRMFGWIYQVVVLNVREQTRNIDVGDPGERMIDESSTRLKIYSNFDWSKMDQIMKMSLDRLPAMAYTLSLEFPSPASQKNNNSKIIRLVSPTLVDNGVEVELLDIKDAGVCPAHAV